MKTSETFIHERLQALSSASQWIVASRDGQTTVINTYSFDQFYPYRLVPAHHRKQCKDYQVRQQYTLPNTPKVILLANSLEPNQQMLLLAQRGQFSLQKILAYFQNNKKSELQFMLQLIIAAEMLMKKYGYFRFTSGMIRASKGPSLILWISQNQADNSPQFPIGSIYPINLEKPKISNRNNQRSPVQTMIQSLFQVICQKTLNKTIIQILKEQKEQLTFQYVKKRILRDIKDQNLMSKYTISTPSTCKYRRFTQQKNRKVPEFILNRATGKGQRKQKKNNSQTFNKSSAVTYSHNQFNKNSLKDVSGIRKMKNTNQKKLTTSDQKLLHSLLAKNCRVDVKQALQSSIQRVQQNQRKLDQNNDGNVRKKEEKPVVRQSGKSISTSSAQYISVNSSGKKFFQGTFSTEQDTLNSITLVKKNETKVNSIFIRGNKKEQEENQSLYIKQFPKAEMQIASKIIEENYEDIHPQSQSQSNRTPRSPSILYAMRNSNKMSQKSIASPGSEFFKDVDLILHSGAFSPKMSEQMYNIQGELRDILDD